MVRCRRGGSNFDDELVKQLEKMWEQHLEATKELGDWSKSKPTNSCVAGKE